MVKKARYVQVKHHILEGIRNHVWTENTKIPSENELVKSCSVSRMTARRAIQELIQEGVLVSHQGMGTFVSEAKSRSSVMTLKNIADEIHSRNNEHHCHILKLEKQFNREISQLLGLAYEKEIYFSRIIHFENKIPIQLEERFVNPVVATDYIKQDFTNYTPNEYLTRVCPVSEADHIIEAVLPTDNQSLWLQMSKHNPCLKLTRTTWSDGKIASLAWLYHPGDRYQLGNHLAFRSIDATIEE